MLASNLNNIVESFNKLDLDNQEYLYEIFHNQIIEKKRLAIINDIKESENNINSGSFKKGSVYDLLAELEND